MTRLYRPAIPIEVRCRVALRQLGELFIDDVIRANRFVPRVVPARSLGRLLDKSLRKLAELLGCPLYELRLDHDPALENRMKRSVFKRSRWITEYSPDANDPDHLFYRPHSAEFEGSHHVKTNVRGDHGQYPDNTIAKRERRRNKKMEKKRCSRCLTNWRLPPSKLCRRCQKVAKKFRDKFKRDFQNRRKKR